MTLEVYTSFLLEPAAHGFFTRKGGASSGIFQGLNCGPGSTDQAEAVEMNRSRVAAHMDVPHSHLLTLHQVHSADVVTISEPFGERPRADAMVSATPGLALGVLTADCMPVLFSDAQARVIGAAHAGWRGALDGVLEATLDAMESLGARREDIQAKIGPSISQRAYEVGPEFHDNFVSRNATYNQFFADGIGDHKMFDLPAFGLHRLHTAGVGKAQWIGQCTYSDPEHFFSYRHATHNAHVDYGRLISAIRL